MPAKRAVRDFAVTSDPWPLIESWAASQGYKPIETNDGHRIMKKGTGFFAGSRMVEITFDKGHVRLESWVHANTAARILGLFLIPANMTIESGGFRGAVPRKLGRDEVNPLLETFGQPAIT
jgi:hypothetical protein